jgi:formyltetrahydrofolate deformylase
VLVSCPDQRGIVAAVTAFVFEHGGNIVDLQQHTDRADAAFFQRVEFELDGFDLAREDIEPALAPLVERFGMRCAVRFTDVPANAAILVSREGHCLYDLLNRARTRELDVDIGAVVSNHADHGDVSGWYGVPYHHLPVTPESKQLQEQQVLDLLDAAGVELVVLARYMQVLSPHFVDRWAERIINIHHSFLPAFQGARPYHQAHERGVKVIGVTAHYVTAALDEGPIIDQDVVRVSHRDDIDALRARGRDLEVTVLARAVQAHLEHRVLVYGHRTIVFD